MVKALIAAGGSSKRMGQNKLLIKIGGKFVIEKTLHAFCDCKKIDEIIVATDNEEIKAICKNAVSNKKLSLVRAGTERQYSVQNGLELVQNDDIVLIHDAARPFVSQKLIEACIESAANYGSGVAALPVYDSLKKADKDMLVLNSIDREGVFAMQTPQAFLGKIIKEAHKQDTLGTDDAFLVEKMGKSVKLVMGEKANIKLTVKEDVESIMNKFRIGQGYDVHKLVENRDLILCGVKIPYEFGLLGHSDADAATHALMDAMLGAAGCGDIGGMFPDTDESFKGANSIKLLEEVVNRIEREGYRLLNCDITIIAQKPKLKDYIMPMRKNLSKALGIDASYINVKATTTEHLGFEGRGEGISAMAVAMLEGV